MQLLVDLFNNMKSICFMFICFNSYNGVAAAYSNDDRQRAVNRRAEYVGASSGTARY